MATETQKILTILSFILLLYLKSLHNVAAQDEATNKNISWWCSTTPHPHPCNYYLNRFHPRSALDFRTMTVVAAMERAVDAKSRARKLSSPANTTRDKVEQGNCDDLLDYTILQLNSTLQRITLKPSSADSDMQTWLSAALTTIEICTSMGNNVSELIRNSLAANAAVLKHDRGDSGLSSYGDRKVLLQNYVWASKANVVVSKDGSGQFSSIQEAINNVTGNRVGKKRVIVYVKKGIYEENVVIDRLMNKVMLVGDGVRNTVITGNRSSSAGFTTYTTATFGQSFSRFRSSIVISHHTLKFLKSVF